MIDRYAGTGDGDTWSQRGDSPLQWQVREVEILTRLVKRVVRETSSMSVLLYKKLFSPFYNVCSI